MIQIWVEHYQSNNDAQNKTIKQKEVWVREKKSGKRRCCGLTGLRSVKIQDYVKRPFRNTHAL